LNDTLLGGDVSEVNDIGSDRDKVSNELIILPKYSLVDTGFPFHFQEQILRLYHRFLITIFRAACNYSEETSYTSQRRLPLFNLIQTFTHLLQSEA
jgi:hypothetical protein